MRCLPILIVALLAGIAHAGPADDHIVAAKKAFDKGDYPAALAEYQKAFALESTPANALRVFVASTYVDELSAATQHLDAWFVKKQDDAGKHGDTDESWKMVDKAVTALRGAALRSEKKNAALGQQVADLEKKVADLQNQLFEQRIVVKSIKSDYEKQLFDMKRAFEQKFNFEKGIANQGTERVNNP